MPTPLPAPFDWPEAIAAGLTTFTDAAGRRRWPPRDEASRNRVGPFTARPRPAAHDEPAGGGLRRLRKPLPA